MARSCNLCQRTFTSDRGYDEHNYTVHRFPIPPPLPSRIVPHGLLSARKCDPEGNFIAEDAPPPPRENAPDWWPFDDRNQFEFTEWHYEKVQTSKGEVNQLLANLAAQKVKETGDPDAAAFYETADDMTATIDTVPYGNIPFTTFHLRYTGPLAPETPEWKLKTYTVHMRNPLLVAEHMASSSDFASSWDYTPYEEYTDNDTCRRFCNLMSGTWANKKATHLGADPVYHGAMFTPVILGADKTTVSVATGHQEFHPVYMSLGNIANDMRRAHRDAVVPIAFLAIPKLGRTKSTDEWRKFVKELYHKAIAQVLSPLRPAMLTPHVMLCPDGHYRRAIFELGPFIADYPEQVCLSGIVQGWCPKCRAFPDELERAGPARFRAHTETVIEAFSPAVAWDVFGINADVEPFTNFFPRADIHDLLSPDLLHQLIKGTFKDHIVEWVIHYVYLSSGTEQEAEEILDEIDRRVAAAAPFPGLRRFPHGRNYSQWTGDDSKALMKVYLGAIAGLVPDKMVQCVAALLDFCYIARRSEHDTHSLQALNGALQTFHELRTVFLETGVRPDGFSLPRQHALVHYPLGIEKFGSPNGLCSSITESKHIGAVKETWRRSSRNGPINQMTRCLERMSKMSAARVEFGRRGMLHGDVLNAARLDIGDPDTQDSQAAKEDAFPYVRVNDLSVRLDLPELQTELTRFLHSRLFPDGDIEADADLDEFPHVSQRRKVAVYSSASVVFHAPSEECGPRGMHREIIRCNPKWYGWIPRFDTVLVTTNLDLWGMPRFRIARIRQFLSISHEGINHEGALVEWFFTQGQHPDGVTGMWIVCPEMVDGQRAKSIIPLGSIARACHLLPVHGQHRLPPWFHHLDAFDAYYVNHYVDYHAHETLV
ncbi:hypothetical protein K466DRAFT_484334 [Polyporus arcularius HHB13444]|uniref:C2H2-type domain-containing protein n=1 Tax=Polyporus arcularius HHB13444 TaxID=1314778 RepID=A0A5C3PMY9_9APHY|nr:hypothetical protein K466DRAFT_484334 [Polyporus arcularius HHB13444]